MLGSAAPRSRPRYQVILPVECKATLQRGRSSPVVSGWTFNLSETGACVELSHAFTRGTWLRLTFSLDGESLPLPARVGWVAYSGAPDGRSVHGLIFLRMTRKLRHGVQALLRRHGSQQVRPSRIPASLPVECRVPGAPDPALRGWTDDLSQGGCSLLLREQLPAGTRILVTLTGPRGTQSVAARVAWTAPVTGREPGLHRHGVQFLDANPVWEQVLGCGVGAVPRPAGQLAATL